MKISLWISCVFAVMAPSAFANGGGYFRGGVERAGDVVGFEPKETEKIRILDEKLTVALGPKSADVEVRYLMRNETDKKVKVRFGFPVEESFDDDDFMDREMKERDRKAIAAGKLKYCENYTITAEGRSIPAKWQAEENAGDDKRFKGIAGWLVSEITFAGGEEKPVMICFRSSYPLGAWSVSDDTSEGAGLFRYRLSSAACWAGTIGTGRITLKPAGIDPRELKVLKPVSRFKQEGENWVWNFENLEPTLADDIEIEARPEIRGHHSSDETSRYIERGSRWFISHRNYEIQASSTLPPADGHSYDAGNLKGLGDDRVWSEGAKGSGAGEWLELKPVAPKPLAAVEIWPGFARSEALFQANARPKKIMVTLNGEHQFSADIPDAMDSHRIPIRGYTKPVKTIRLTFQEVWPGKKFEDLCISGIWLHVKLDKKPKLEPVR